MNKTSIPYYDIITLQMYYKKTINAHKGQSQSVKQAHIIVWNFSKYLTQYKIKHNTD